jgi:hypothetical protein
MFTVKCSLHFLGTSDGNIMTHAYWRKCNTVMWDKKYQSDITALSATLWNSWVANNYLLTSNYSFPSVWLQTERPGFSPWHRERTYPVAPVSTPALRPTQPQNQKASGVERGRGCDADHSPPSSAEVKNESFSPCRLPGGIVTDLFYFYNE